MKDIILFDLDGTITDPKVGITKSVQYALQYFNIDVDNPDNLCNFIGPPLRQSFKDFYSFDDFEANKAVEKYREYYLDKGIYENVLYDGMYIMLKKLKDQEKKLILATSKPTVQAEKVLSYFGLTDFFTFISGSELNGDRSDKKEIILYALEKNNIQDLKHCLMIGDRKYDIIGANAVGMDNVGVLYGYGSLDELTEANATYIVNDINELSKLLCL